MLPDQLGGNGENLPTTDAGEGAEKRHATSQLRQTVSRKLRFHGVASLTSTRELPTAPELGVDTINSRRCRPASKQVAMSELVKRYRWISHCRPMSVVRPFKAQVAKINAEAKNSACEFRRGYLAERLFQCAEFTEPTISCWRFLPYRAI